MEAFHAGIRDGANALEMDVRCTKDNQIVVFHDDNGLRVAGESAKVIETTFAEIQKWKIKVPLLQEVLESFPEIPLNVDVKDRDPVAAKLVVDLMRRFGAQKRTLLTGVTSDIIKSIQKCGYEGAIGMSKSDVAFLYFTPKLFIGNRFVGRAAQVPVRKAVNFATRAFIDKCHAVGARVDFWVVNDKETARRLWNLGADGIMSDDPGALI